MSTEQYLERCKARAREHVLKGELRQAVAVMGMDLGRYPELKPAPFLIELGLIAASCDDERGCAPDRGVPMSLGLTLLAK